MNILVCISQVPDTTTRIRFTDNKKEIETAGIQWVINPWDELSLTRALELKEQSAGKIGKVAVAHVGPVSSDAVIRKALAIGADEAYRVDAAPIDAFQVSAELSAMIKGKDFDLILCGIDSSDYNGSAVGGMLAEWLEIPSVSAISGIDIENGELRITRDIDGGKQQLMVDGAFVGIVQKGIAKEPRIAAMRGIMQARTKPIHVIPASTGDALTQVLGFEASEPREACRFVDAEEAEKLIVILQQETKLI